MTVKKLRCAIYTRKSTEEGLDKEFNTLDAQREAGEAYVKSQMHEGWQVIPTAYDDGGYTGGNMDRPALKQLMTDVKAGKVQVIVVYKVDRLTRSLADFAKIVEMLDEYGVSFVSVTQQFNTSTSMGRLTLNVLLSFAQFEREVIGERVRDKIAASKKKGMWIGGFPPLGYDIKHRKLQVNESEAKLIRRIFTLYLEHRSAEAVMRQINEKGYRNKQWVTKKGREMGSKPFQRTIIYRLLNDPLYIGKIKHKEHLYEGQHEAILPQELWDQVQALLQQQDVHQSKLRTESSTILRGKCFDGKGHTYTTAYSVRKKQRHIRYYINKYSNHRIRGDKLETVAFDTIHYACLQQEHLRECFTGEYALLSEEKGVYKLQQLWGEWDGLTEKDKHGIAQQMIDHITILPNSTTIRIRYDALNQLLKERQLSSIEINTVPDIANEPNIGIYNDALETTVPVISKKRGKTSQALSANGKAFEVFKTTNYNMPLVNALAKSFKWNRLIADGEKTITALAEENSLSRSYVSKMLNLVCLAPSITAAILNGTQPKELRVKDLLKPMPIGWHEQNALLSL